MNKMDDLKDLVNISKLNELLNKKEAEEEKKAALFKFIGKEKGTGYEKRADRRRNH